MIASLLKLVKILSESALTHGMQEADRTLIDLMRTDTTLQRIQAPIKFKMTDGSSQIQPPSLWCHPPSLRKCLSKSRSIFRKTLAILKEKKSQILVLNMIIHH
jgi:hypothetical protein